jgi:pimeloyl-ACP methyl ester carboxylesterase
VLAPDLPGFGDSPATQGDFTMEGCAREVYSFLGGRGAGNKVVLVGLSMGGYIAFEFVRLFPEKIRGLILVATHPFPDSETAAKGRQETAEFVLNEGSEALADRFVPKLLGKTTLENKPEVVQRCHELIVDNSPLGIAKACYGLASRRDSNPQLPHILAPTLIMAGAEDALIPENRSREMAQQIKTSQIEILEECGHLVNLEQPQAFHERVFRFLKSLD